jgi:glycosyltransferase involved in cell wall biosynthesis
MRSGSRGTFLGGVELRILHVTPSFYEAWAYGGIPRCSYELCLTLARLGEQVEVWTTDVFDAEHRIPLADRERVVGGIQIRCFANLSNRLAYHAQLYLPLRFLHHARRRLSDFDVVHIHSHRHLLEWIVSALASRRNLPTVFTGNGTVPAIERRVWVKRVIDLLGAHLPIQRAAACIAVSHAEVAHYRAVGVDQTRIAVIPNGVRVSDFEPLPARGEFRRRYGIGTAPLVVFVGKITPRKGLDLLLRAVARLPPATHLAVVGNFMMSDRGIRQLAEDLSLGDRVHFTGLLLGRDKLSAYVDADAVAYPSVDEIFGLVAAESLMCGTPVVVCEDSGCGEVVRAAGGGLLVPYGDIAALANALGSLLDGEHRREELVTRGRKYVAENFDWDDIGARTVAIYRKVTGASDAAA